MTEEEMQSIVETDVCPHVDGSVQSPPECRDSELPWVAEEGAFDSLLGRAGRTWRDSLFTAPLIWRILQMLQEWGPVLRIMNCGVFVALAVCIVGKLAGIAAWPALGDLALAQKGIPLVVEVR